MKATIHLACEVCGEEFLLDLPAYKARSGIVECPLCGSLDLVLLDPGDAVSPAVPAA